MSLIAVTAAPGNSGVTTSTVALSSTVPEGQAVVMAECDPSGGDIAGWIDNTGNPSWVTAVAAGDRSWDGFCRHLQKLPSGQQVMLSAASSARAEASVGEAGDRFAAMLAALSDVVVFADCGRLTEITAWHRRADLIVVQAHQEPSSGYATVARVDRTIEVVKRLKQARCRVGLLVVGERPYRPEEIAGFAHVELVGSVPHDASAAATVSGAWSLGKGPGRSKLVKAFRPISARLVDAVTDPEAPATPVGETPDADVFGFERKDVS